MWELDVRGADGPLAKAVVGAGARIGRAPNCDLVLAHPSVSRLHARVEDREGRLWLVDAGSRNGLRIAERRVPAVRLDEGREFLLGELNVAVRRVAAARVAGGAPLEFAEDVRALLERTAFRDADGPLLEDAALEEPAGIELASRAAPPAAPAAARAAPSLTERRAAVLAEGGRGGGALSGDLSQQPAWVRVAAWVAVPAVLVAAAWGAFWLVQRLG